MAAGKLAFYVTVADSKGEQHTFGPDSDVPAWAAKAITNPSAWETTGDGEANDDSEESEDVKPYAKWRKGDLEAEVEARNADRDEDDQIVVGGTGTVKDLAAALDADDEGNDEGDDDSE